MKIDPVLFSCTWELTPQRSGVLGVMIGPRFHIYPEQFSRQFSHRGYSITSHVGCFSWVQSLNYFLSFQLLHQKKCCFILYRVIKRYHSICWRGLREVWNSLSYFAGMCVCATICNGGVFTIQSLKLVHEGLINNTSVLTQVMALCRTGDRLLPEYFWFITMLIFATWCDWRDFY